MTGEARSVYAADDFNIVYFTAQQSHAQSTHAQSVLQLPSQAHTSQAQLGPQQQVSTEAVAENKPRTEANRIEKMDMVLSPDNLN
jgi:hypothetical protein